MQARDAGYGPRGAKAFTSGALGTCINPEKGWLNSRMRNRAPAVDRATTARNAKTVPLICVKRLKLRKMTIIQKTSTARNGAGTGVSFCAKRSRRVFASSALTSTAQLFRDF